MRRKILALASGLLLVTLGYAGMSDIQDRAMTKSLLERQVSIGRLNEITTTDALSQALSDAHTPGGLVTILGCSQAAKHTFKPSNSSLHAVFDSVLSAEPQYKWQVEGGVVNVTRSTGDPALLNLHITHFKLVNARTIYEGLNYLLALPEVQKRIAELKLQQSPPQLGIMPGQINSAGEVIRENQHISIDQNNITVHDALNAIVRAHGRAVWSYTERHCNGQAAFSIDFLVR